MLKFYKNLTTGWKGIIIIGWVLWAFIGLLIVANMARHLQTTELWLAFIVLYPFFIAILIRFKDEFKQKEIGDFKLGNKMKDKHFYILLSFFLIVLIITANITRYTLFSMQTTRGVYKLDRWTGEVTVISRDNVEKKVDELREN